MKQMSHRIVSLLPSGTEIACALRLGKELVGITHCCKYPGGEIEGKPLVVRGALPVEEMSLSQIDKAVAERLRRGESLYLVDEVLLRKLSPTLLLTQDLCQVCAPSGNEVSRALKMLTPKPEVIWMSPHSLGDIESDILAVGAAADRGQEAESLVSILRERTEKVRRACASASKTRVFCAEWLDPLYCSGHWVPEMVGIAGGEEVLGRKWRDSVRISWESVRAAEPEVIIVMPCGMNCAQSRAAIDWLRGRPGFEELPAARNGRVFAVDASYFSTPGPRVVDGIELLGHLLHPELCEWRGARDAFSRMSSGRNREERPGDIRKARDREPV